MNQGDSLWGTLVYRRTGTACTHFSCVQAVPAISSSQFHSHSNMLYAVQITKFLSMQFTPASCSFLPPRTKYSPQHRIFKNNLCSLLSNMQISHRLSDSFSVQKLANSKLDKKMFFAKSNTYKNSVHRTATYRLTQ
jgi:hypothetical protein